MDDAARQAGAPVAPAGSRLPRSLRVALTPCRWTSHPALKRIAAEKAQIGQDPDVRRTNQPVEVAVGKIERARAEALFAAIQKRTAPGPAKAEAETAARTARLRALRLAKEKADAAKAADTRKPRRLPQALVHG